MIKREFMDALEKGLSSLPNLERYDIMSDYEEHFVRGLEAGKSEEEICESLGDPVAIASEYVGESKSERRENSTASSFESNRAYEHARDTKDENRSHDKGYVYERDAKTENRGYDYKYSYRFGKPRDDKGSSEHKESRTVLIAILLILVNVMFVLPIYMSLAAVWLGLMVAGFALVLAGIVMIFAAIAHILFLFGGLALIAAGGLLGIGVWLGGLYIVKLTKWYINMNVNLAKGGSAV